MSSQVVNFTIPLNQAFGYGIVVGLGFAFAFLMMATTWALRRYIVLFWDEKEEKNQKRRAINSLQSSCWAIYSPQSLSEISAG
jgi:hypothetical protein